MTRIYEIAESLNQLAYSSTAHGSDAQKAANDWAGTTGLDLLYALNKKAGTNGLDFNKVCNVLASTTGKEAQDALSNLAGGGHT